MKTEVSPAEYYGVTNGSNSRIDSDEVAMRPNTLNVTRNDKNVESKKFIRYCYKFTNSPIKRKHTKATINKTPYENRFINCASIVRLMNARISFLFFRYT